VSSWVLSTLLATAVVVLFTLLWNSSSCVAPKCWKVTDVPLGMQGMSTAGVQQTRLLLQQFIKALQSECRLRERAYGYARVCGYLGTLESFTGLAWKCLCTAIV